MNATIPLALCLFTSTKGHFDVKTRYLETLNSLDKQIPLSYFSARFARVTVSPGEEAVCSEMLFNLSKKDFICSTSDKNWAHGQQSHQDGYLSDLNAMYTNPKALENQYCLHLEDDWIFHSFEGDLLKHFAHAIEILRTKPDILQVRFARFSDEKARIAGLYAKHGINGLTIDEKNYFRSNDFSLNPSIFRTRDLKICSNLFHNSTNNRYLAKHVEHGFGAMMKVLSPERASFAVLDPVVKVAHIGTKLGEEDPVDKQVFAN